LGFSSTEERDEFNESCEEILNATMAEIEIQSKGWATYEDGFPTEIDFVGASSSSDSIFIIEAKQLGSSSDKLYYSPIQVASYAIAWSKAIKIEGFLDTVNALIKAKRKASLIPDYCPEIKPNPTVTPVLLLPAGHMSLSSVELNPNTPSLSKMKHGNRQVKPLVWTDIMRLEINYEEQKDPSHHSSFRS